MPAIHIVPEEVRQRAQSHANTCSEWMTRLTGLKNEVENMLNDELVLPQASPAIRDAYQQFTTSLTQAIHGLENFGEAFTSIAKGAEDFDSQIAANFNKK
ncbi:WXG100 family type VII secretion target [Actinacidiphila sp. bgisy167]|uniref:WXG100 family type VII secretion target n=1 Tax=Actinacidiphila sp. bgisy167 TaxID=3413797 RepID=UPI003D73D77C